MKHYSYCLILLLFVSCSKASDPKAITGAVPLPPPEDKGWTFEATPLWAEEFEYTGLPDDKKWGYDVGGSGWGNNELQYYTDKVLSNASVANGKLTITARKEAMNGMNYTSARLVSRTKGDFLYGRITVRAKLPAGRGTWPAIWMLPTDWEYGGWPKSGEIDIMEHVGYDPNNVHFSIHNEVNNGGNSKTSGGKKITTATTDFHEYRVDWTPYAIRGYFDGQLVYTFVNEGKGYTTWPFNKRFHLLLNIAVGGNWGGAQGVDETVFPAAMEIDYVRYYKMIEK